MKQSEFIAWLEGYLHDKVRMGIGEIELIKGKLYESTPQGHTLGYYPDPYIYPGMIKIDNIEIISNKELLEEMDIVAKDIDITNIGDDGIHVCDSFGESYYMNWYEVQTFVNNRKKQNK